MSQPDAVVLWQRRADALGLPPAYVTGYHIPSDSEYRALPAASYAALLSRVEAAEGALDWLREAVDDAEQHAMNTAGDGGYGRWAYQRFMPKWATNARAHIDEIDALRASGTREGE